MHFRPNKVLEALAHHQTINTAELEMIRQNPITPNCNSPNLHSTPLSGSAIRGYRVLPNHFKFGGVDCLMMG